MLENPALKHKPSRRLFVVAGPDAGQIEWRVDGSDWTTQELFTRWSKGLHLPWPLILDDGLKPGKHTITLKTTADAQGRTALHVIHILEN